MINFILGAVCLTALVFYWNHVQVNHIISPILFLLHFFLNDLSSCLKLKLKKKNDPPLNKQENEDDVAIRSSLELDNNDEADESVIMKPYMRSKSTAPFLGVIRSPRSRSVSPARFT